MKKKLLISIVGVMFVAGIVIAGWAAPAQAVTKWKYQSMWAPSITLWRGDKYFGDLMNVLAKGDLEIKYFPGGTLIKTSNEIFDAVKVGSIQMASDWPSYWEGKNTAFGLITSTPMWLNPSDYMLWFWQAGGLELAQELYGKYGLVWYPHSVTAPESGMRSNKPIYKASDYKGVKMRQCGRVQADILRDLGGAAIFMPGAEIYLALSRGTIDAGEFSVPECDWSMGFQEVSKYWVLPGWHQPGPVSGVMINKKAFDKLPDRIKFMFKEAAMSTMMWSWTYFEYSSGEYTRKFIDNGIKITHLDDATLDRIQSLANKYMLADAEKNADYTKIAFSQAKYFKDFAQWRNIQYPFEFGRNPTKIDALYSKLEALAKKQGVYNDVIKLERAVRKQMENQEFWKPGTKYVGNPIMPK
ncbi:MAG: TRAP transporter substrate-binding protein DctP [Deltaproteobacteria bacterium]|nr:TRAP transporter substrate-binding protein DctP [Deltaproteobacteria bacterium]